MLFHVIYHKTISHKVRFKGSAGRIPINFFLMFFGFLFLIVRNFILGLPWVLRKIHDKVNEVILLQNALLISG